MLRKLFVFVLLLCTCTAFSQFAITGRITDENGKALVGANVLIKKLSLGASTGPEGSYKLSNVPEGLIYLEITFLGYKPINKEHRITGDIVINESMVPSSILGEEIIVRSTRAAENSPFTFSVIEKPEIEQKNLGQDIPFLLSMEPSVVSSSDAGAGVGYTSLWIRGSNIQRINVTVNGIPINDPESHGVFWVNMPDFASSVQSAQIQRGVGTSTNGGGAFGATLNLETNYVSRTAFCEINSSYGSFNTLKNTVRFGSGLLGGKWAFEGRASKISSDGYIDRASSDLKSFFIQGGYFGKTTTIKALVFSGKEKTFQAWNGIDQQTLDTSRTSNSCGAIYDENWNIVGYYENETDNYQQDHYQLHFSKMIGSRLKFNASLHYTYGRGYYENYYSNEYLANYPMGIQLYGYDSTWTGIGYNYFFHDTISYGDMIVRRWLDNDFYGATFALHYKINHLNITLGGAWNDYTNAKNFGEVIWAEYSLNARLGDKFYESGSDKKDFNTFIKFEYQLFKTFGLFADLQLRNVKYKSTGTDKDISVVDIDESYSFFNPKAGLTFDLEDIGLLYASYALSHREPIRTDFLDAPSGVKPKPEVLQDIEGGIRKEKKTYSYAFNAYYMYYSNQLVLTGAINDVGSPIRENIGKSIRYGIELSGRLDLLDWLSFNANLTLGKSSTDYRRLEIDTIKMYDNTPLTFSPEIIAGYSVGVRPLKNLEIRFNGKYVGKQYLDLTGNNRKSIAPYYTNDFAVSYHLLPKTLKEISLSFTINNIWGTKYNSNGYIYNELAYYYPQAGINYLAGASIKF